MLARRMNHKIDWSWRSVNHKMYTKDGNKKKRMHLDLELQINLS